VKEYIAAHRDDGVTQALDDIYGPDRGLEHLQSASLPREDW
jgi:murein L,D-transpeptidase YcbB/YkuD